MICRGVPHMFIRAALSSFSSLNCFAYEWGNILCNHTICIKKNLKGRVFLYTPCVLKYPPWLSRPTLPRARIAQSFSIKARQELPVKAALRVPRKTTPVLKIICISAPIIREMHVSVAEYLWSCECICHCISMCLPRNHVSSLTLSHMLVWWCRPGSQGTMMRQAEDRNTRIWGKWSSNVSFWPRMISMKELARIKSPWITGSLW